MSFWKNLFGSKGPQPLQPHTTREDTDGMRPLDQLLGTLLESWDQRYQFALDQEKRELEFSVPGFQLLATETEADKITLTFEEAGTRHRLECSLDEAPRIIEALLFPES